MKVLMTTDTVGGMWYYALELVRALERFDVEVVLVTMGADLSRAQRMEVQARPNVVLYESRYRTEWMPEPWKDVREAGKWLLEIEERTEPDVVHLNNYAHGVLSWQAPVLMTGHSCVLSWWQAVHGKPAPLQWAYYRRIVNDGLQAASMVVAPTHAMLIALEGLYGPLTGSRMIPNARDPQAYLPGRKEPWVLAAGRLWDEGKNVRALVQIAPSLSWPVLVAGEAQGPDGTEVSLAGVHALGKLSSTALAGCYARASIYVLPARYEPFGLSALEAALAGCALVLGDIPSLHEIWENAAVFVPPEDPEALKRAIEALITNDHVRNRYAAGARNRALNFAPARMGAAYYSSYSKLVAAPRHRSPSLLASR
jgi:glycogen(starch) synthase